MSENEILKAPHRRKPRANAKNDENNHTFGDMPHFPLSTDGRWPL
jgi:hypothetical protein